MRQGTDIRSRVAWALVALYVVLVVSGLRMHAEMMGIGVSDVWVFFALGWGAIIGALNWGMMALFHINVVEQIVGMGMATWIYMLVGLAGIMLLVSYVYVCPSCRKMKAA